MIDVAEAKQRVITAAVRKPAERVVLVDALGRYVAEDVIAPFDHPLFDCSAMDGYAFAHGATGWNVVGEVAAGDVFPRALVKGECVRVFTGAMLPQGADTVVMQELAHRSGSTMMHSDTKLKYGGNVRRKGEQLKAGAVVMAKGLRLDASAIGLLASVGLAEVAVTLRPLIALLISGNEFAEGAKPQPGKIFGSNGVMLQAALRELGIQADIVQVDDDREAMIAAWKKAAKENDLIISTGGVSVGDHDLVRPSLDALGAGVIFHGVMQKPGKPMLFAMLNDTPIFGLPGNPRAVMVLFHEYVAPFIRATQGAAEPWMRMDRSPILQAVSMKGNRAEFRAALVANGNVRLLADEGSHMLRSLTEANALAYIPAEVREIKKGEPVEVHYIR